MPMVRAQLNRSSGATTRSSSDRVSTGFHVSGITVFDYTPSPPGVHGNRWVQAGS
jgi:hypothetical protein